VTSLRSRYALSYPAWILLCAILFFALRHADDPSRRGDRILNNDAAVLALRILDRTDHARYRGYEVVHVAYAGKGEGGALSRWVVLCDRVPHSGLEEAVVVEVDAGNGGPIEVRKPVGAKGSRAVIPRKPE
jgi:hypothetical protein